MCIRDRAMIYHDNELHLCGEKRHRWYSHLKGRMWLLRNQHRYWCLEMWKYRLFLKSMMDLIQRSWYIVHCTLYLEPGLGYTSYLTAIFGKKCFSSCLCYQWYRNGEMSISIFYGGGIVFYRCSPAGWSRGFLDRLRGVRNDQARTSLFTY